MYLHRSNSIEELVGALTGVLERPLRSCFDREIIVVQSRGMQRWLSIQLSARLGVLANAEFPFPRAFVEGVFRNFLPEVVSGRGAPLSREYLTWAIAGALPDLLSRKEFAPLVKYLEGEARGLRRVELAERIARVFDQYVVYRPDLVLGWEAGKGSDWQAELWRKVVRDKDCLHVAALADRFLSEWSPLFASSATVPERVSIFGVSSLPPLYVSVLGALAERTEVHLFLLSPCEEYWAHTRSRRDIERERRKLSIAVKPEVLRALHLEEGNALLGSLGHVGRDFQFVLEARTNYVEPNRTLFRDPGTQNLLSALKSDMLGLRRRGTAGVPRLPWSPHDTSIVVHSCHSALREVEVVRDQLLQAFQEDPSLEPRDVLVMAPDLERYAPLIEAVFTTTKSDEPNIPFRVADRVELHASAVIDAFLTALELAEGRMKASEVLDLLEFEPVRRRFDITAEDLPTVQHWVHDAGVRFGIDRAHRARLGLPEVDEHTFDFGLTRLFLGYAMSERGTQAFAGFHPYGGRGANGSELLGALAEYCRTLFDLARQCEKPRPLGEWRETLTALLERLLFVYDADAWQLQLLRDALGELVDTAALAGFSEPVPLEVVREALRTRFSGERGARAFLTGGVTFCALLPMRSIPARIVVLLGMNDGEFPRNARSPDFDKMVEEPRPGDRSVRSDDRYLFLETLLSARERLILTYVGRDIHDDSKRPPSVVVEELFDAIDQTVVLESGGRVSPALVVEHPLQAFSPRYFDLDPDGRLFSYAEMELRGARALLGEKKVETPFQASPLAESGQPGDIDLDELVRFLENPAKHYLRKRLGIYLDEEPELVDDHDPIELSSLDEWKVGDWLLKRASSEPDVSVQVADARREGLLPFGMPGECLLADAEAQVRAILARAAEWKKGERLEPLELRLDVAGRILSGTLAELWPNAQVVASYSKIRPKRELGLWVRHLGLSLAPSKGYPKTSVLIGRATETVVSGSSVFEPVPKERAQALLEQLVGYYALGQQFPLPLFPESSWNYMQALRKAPDGADHALAAARLTFEKKEYSESREPYARLAFRGASALDDPRFVELTTTIFGPLFEFRRET